MNKKDPSKIQEPKYATEREIAFRLNQEKYFNESLGSVTEKLNNFAKYVPRQKLAKFISRYELFKKVLTVQGSIIAQSLFSLILMVDIMRL